jgi:hypothetical protein|tara:strand:+ start:542 stop:745 length:204 start_codon:yes stop_codon:yes gene_type:complete
VKHAGMSVIEIKTVTSALMIYVMIVSAMTVNDKQIKPFAHCDTLLGAGIGLLISACVGSVIALIVCL